MLKCVYVSKREMIVTFNFFLLCFKVKVLSENPFLEIDLIFLAILNCT